MSVCEPIHTCTNPYRKIKTVICNHEADYRCHLSLVSDFRVWYFRISDIVHDTKHLYQDLALLNSVNSNSFQLRREFEKEKQEAICKALASKQDGDSSEGKGEATQGKADGENAAELEKLIARHKQEISATKKKQWVRWVV